MMNAFESPLPDDRLSELHQLASAALNENLSDEQAARLDQLVCQDEEFRKQYIRYMYVSWNLRTWAKFPLADDSESPLQPLMPADVDEALLRQLQVPSSEPAAPSVPSFLGNFVHGTVGFFSQEVPFAMLTATIITSLGLLAGSFVYVSHHESTAQKSQPSSPSVAIVSSSQFEHIGRITGMVDVKWSDINTSTELGNAVSLGRRYALSSGLMEITYHSGAKVILQGPVTYKVDSPTGGFLSVGKLTAKLEKRGSEVRDQGSEKVASGQWLVASEANPKSQISNSRISNPQSPIPNPLLPPAPLFTVRTPTAVITDLGTEFGVEVSTEGHTNSHVFHGSVRIQAEESTGSVEIPVRILHENESVSVETDGKNRHVIIKDGSCNPASFVRAENFSRLSNESKAKKRSQPIERWMAYSRQLRQDPSLVVYYDFQRQPGSPRTLLNVANNGDRKLNGVIENARWVTGRLPGKDAVRFLGSMDRIRINVPGQFERLTMAAWVKMEGRNAWNGIVMADGWNTVGQVHWQLVADGRCEFSVKNIPPLRNDYYCPPIFRGDSSEKWQHVAVVADITTRSITFYVNGLMVGKERMEEATPMLIGPAQIGNFSPATLSGDFDMHGFIGRIDELAIFRRAFTEQEIQTFFKMSNQ